MWRKYCKERHKLRKDLTRVQAEKKRNRESRNLRAFLTWKTQLLPVPKGVRDKGSIPS
jgi:hypothetical protein